MFFKKLRKMKKYSIIFLLFSLLFSNCSSDSFELDPNQTKINYLRSAHFDKDTHFVFEVTSLHRKTVSLYLEAITVFDDKITSNHFVLKPEEKQEITLIRRGVLTSKNYIKSYRVTTKAPDQHLPNKRPNFEL